MVLGFIFCLPLSAPPLYAGGRSVQNLSRAGVLIAEQRCDEAIRILSDFSRKKPGRFAEAQVRLQKIYLTRDEYNRIAAELLDEVNADSPDVENANNPMVQTFIDRVRNLAQFNQYRQRLNRIARPASIVMNSQDEAAYNQALMEYQQGNYIMALAILQRLLQNPQYRNIAKILELERRVRSLLL